MTNFKNSLKIKKQKLIELNRLNNIKKLRKGDLIYLEHILLFGLKYLMNREKSLKNRLLKTRKMKELKQS